MAPRRHLTRHDMKEDEIVSWLSRAGLWVEENARMVLIGAGCLAILAALVAGGFWWRSSQREAAFAALATIQRLASAPLIGEPGAVAESAATVDERASKTVDAADEMLKRFPSGTAGGWARYARAGALLELRRLDAASTEALAVADTAGPSSLLGGLATVMAGRAEEARGNLQRAVELYEQAAASTDTSFPTEVALLDQARCQRAMGESQAATNTYQKILDVYPDSPMAEKANRMLRELREGSGGT